MMRHVKETTRRRISGFVTDRVIDVIAATWRGPSPSKEPAKCAVCGGTTITMVQPVSGECLCPSHTGTALLMWPGARALTPPREITVDQATRIAGDRRADWLTCARCRGTRGPVEFLSWPDGAQDHHASAWCANCWGEISAGEVSRVMVAQVPPVDQPTCCLDLRETRAAALRWQPAPSESPSCSGS